MQGWKLDIGGDANDGGLGLLATVVQQDLEKLGPVEADVDETVGEHSHLGSEEPDLGGGGRVDGVGDPGQRVGDRLRVFFPFVKPFGKVTVELTIPNDMQGGAGNVLSLLVAGGDESRSGIDADVRLSQSVAENGGLASVGGNSKDAAIVLSQSGRLLAAFGNDELAIRSEPNPARELSHVCGLSKRVGEKFVPIGFPVAVRIQDSPYSAFIKGEYFVVANGHSHGFVKTGRKSPPANFFEIALEPVD